MKIATYFMKVCGAGLIVLCGFIMFIYGLASNYTNAFDAFWGLAVMSAGVVLLAYILETTECPIKLSVAKNEPSPAPADTTSVPAIKTDASEASAPEQAE